jgi:UDP-glucuronate decarboxylase
VLCADNFYTGAKDNIRHLLGDTRFELIRHDVWLPLYVEVDRIYNLACPASPIHYQRDPVSTVKTSVLGAINMLGLAKRRGARLLQASTSEVYGDPRQHPQPEELLGPRQPDRPARLLRRRQALRRDAVLRLPPPVRRDVRVARIFNTYGPRMHPRDGRVVSNFIVQALCGEPITLYGDGSQTRSFCYVDDLVEGLVRLMDQDTEIGPVNLGNPVEFTIRELAEQVLRLTDSKSRIEFRPLPADDPTRRQPDITKARNTLDWEPQVALEDGLKETIAYFRNVLKA